MLKKNGTPVQDLALGRERRDQLQISRLSVAGTLPKDFDLTSGQFWAADSAVPLVAISDDEGRRYGFKIGDRLEFQAAAS